MSLSKCYNYKVMLIGDSGVGKSAFFLRLMKNEVAKNLQPTSTIEYATKTIINDGNRINVQLCDSPGREEYREKIIQIYRGCHAFFLFYDITNRTSFANISIWLQELKQHAQTNVLVMVIGNKRDLENRRVVATNEASELTARHGLIFLEMSSFNSSDVAEAFTTLRKSLHGGPPTTTTTATANSSSIRLSSGKETIVVIAKKRLIKMITETNETIWKDEPRALRAVLLTAKAYDENFEPHTYREMFPTHIESSSVIYILYLYMSVVPDLNVPFDQSVEHHFSWDGDLIQYFKALHKRQSSRKGRLLQAALKIINISNNYTDSDERLRSMLLNFSREVWADDERALVAVIATAMNYDEDYVPGELRLDSELTPFALYLFDTMFGELKCAFDQLIARQFSWDVGRSWVNYFSELFQRLSENEGMFLHAALHVITNNETSSGTKRRIESIQPDLERNKVRAMLPQFDPLNIQPNLNERKARPISFLDLSKPFSEIAEDMNLVQDSFKMPPLQHQTSEEKCKILEAENESLRMNLKRVISENNDLSHQNKLLDDRILEIQKALDDTLMERENLQTKLLAMEQELESYKTCITTLSSSYVRLGDNSESNNPRILDACIRLSSTTVEQSCKLKVVNSSQPQNIERLEKELKILLNLQNNFQEQSQRWIVSCLHQELITTDTTISSNLPILTNDLASFNRYSPTLPMTSLVLECGGPNLQEFIGKNKSSMDITSCLQILRDITTAIHFIHGHSIVHCDLKPENIVAFPSLKEGMVRWKLIDFDSCHDLNSNLSTLIGSMDFSHFTSEYSAPELIEFINSPSPSLLQNPPPISYQLDIWSLGMIAVFIFKGDTTWHLLFPHREFAWSMVQQEWGTQTQERLFSSFGKHIQIFLQNCLEMRSSCQVLLDLELFTTIPSFNSLRTLTGEESRMLEELTNLFTAEDEKTEEIRVQLSELCVSLRSSR